ncbi:MAG: DNA-binding response regulator [Verrucomicrobiales bacterium]|nr:DNA-binding response regulator [Verrucomicrobiales bacterium]|tara:strand:- start:1249 stop:1887 length:639 start_codon:yes stop_codon:yes gene_type:complete
MSEDEKKKIRVMLVDDHFAVRVGMAASLKFEEDIDIIAEAGSGEDAVKLFAEHKPDVCVMDWRLPGISGVEAVQEIRKDHPDAKIIMLSVYEGEEDVFRAMEAGASAYVLKSADRPEVIEAIRTVLGGNKYLPPILAGRLADRMTRSELTSRERGVLDLIVAGNSNKEIAAKLGLAEITVKQHVSSVLDKLNVQDRTQAATAAIQRGIVHLE